jgi:hypothetical protein
MAMKKGSKTGKSLMGGKGKPNFVGGSKLNFGKGSGETNATPGSTYHAPQYGNSSKGKPYKEGKGC